MVPTRDVVTKLHNSMKTKMLASKSPAWFPPFDPHITLVTVPSKTNLDKLRAAIPTNRPIIPVTFKSVEVGHKYFILVYVNCPSCRRAEYATREPGEAFRGDG